MNVAKILLVAFGCLAIEGRSYGQTPQVGYVYPPAIQRGTEVDVDIGGYDFTPDMQFFVHDGRLKFKQIGPLGDFHLTDRPYWTGPRQYANALPIAREIPARLTIPHDQKIGLVRWQVANANGGSNAGVFLITDIPEMAERRFKTEQQVVMNLPIGISGRLSRISEVDSYQFTAVKEGLVTIDFWGRRLGSDLNGAIQVVDADGNTVVDEVDTEGQDLTTTFAAKKGMKYTVRIHDTDFRGSRQFVYRIAISDRPRILSAHPARLTRGLRQAVEFSGWGLKSGKHKLETMTTEIESDISEDSLFYRLPTSQGVSIPFRIPVQSTKVEERVDSNIAAPLSISINQAISTVLPRHHASHRFLLEAKMGTSYEVTAESSAINADLDVAIKILDPEQNQVAENDDAKGTVDARLAFQPKANGPHVIVLTGVPHENHDNVDRRYRLQVTAPDAGFELTAGQSFQAKPGGKVEIPVTLKSIGGFAERVDLLLSNLPDGVEQEGAASIEPGKQNGKIVLKVSENTKAQAGLFSIYGRAASKKTGQRTVHLLAPAGGDLCDANATTDRLLLSIVLDAPFSIELVDKNRQRVVHRGTTYAAPFKIKRNDGFRGEIQLVMKAKQSRHRMGIRGETVTVLPDETSALYPCFMPEWISTARTSRMEVIAMAQVADPQGNLRFLTKGADARITMICEGALLKVSHQAKDLVVTPGEQFELPVSIRRNSKLQTDVTIDLILPTELNGLLSYRPVQLGTESDQCIVHVKTKKHNNLRGTYTITARASTLKDGRLPVQSIVDFEVDFLNK